MQKLLEDSEPVIDAEPVNEDVHALRQELDELREQVQTLRSECRQLVALMKSARIVFGNAGASAPSESPASDSDKWEKIKAKVGGKMAQIIEALQLAVVANRTQLKKQTGGAQTTVDAALYKLRDMGFLVKNGDGWSLKP